MGIDIQSPTCPEYIEHHRQVQSIMKIVDEKMDKYRGKEVQLVDK